MGKFNSILICTDLDDTLLTSDKRVSKENSDAIEYFKSEGGFFTFATGRVPEGARLILDFIKPNAPVISFNGAAIYDFRKDCYLWKKALSPDAIKVAELVDGKLPDCGIEVCCADTNYFSKVNRHTERHKEIEKFPDNYIDYHDVTDEWIKVIFMDDEDKLYRVRELIASSEWADKFEFVKTSPWYYEMLAKGSTKGSAVPKLAQLLGLNPHRTIGMGDNENDMSLMTDTGIGIAVANAIEPIRLAADYVTVDNNSHALAKVVEDLKNGKIIFK